MQKVTNFDMVWLGHSVLPKSELPITVSAQPRGNQIDRGMALGKAYYSLEPNGKSFSILPVTVKEGVCFNSDVLRTSMMLKT